MKKPGKSKKALLETRKKLHYFSRNLNIMIDELATVNTLLRLRQKATLEELLVLTEVANAKTHATYIKLIDEQGKLLDLLENQ